MTKHSIEKMTTTYIISNIYTFSYKHDFRHQITDNRT